MFSEPLIARRDPVTEGQEEEDILKTPEEGWRHLDWATEMER